MSQSPTDSRPCPAYAEEFHEESQSAVPGTKTSAQVNQARTKRSKGDEASDSGYSSRTPATSSSGSHRLLKMVNKMTGNTKKSKENEAPPPTSAAKKTVTKMSKNGNLRLDTKKVESRKVESRDDAARMHISGQPLQKTVSSRSHERSPQILHSVKMGPPPAPIPIRMSSTRTSLPRPSSYHAGVPEFPFPLHGGHFPAPIQVTRQVPVHHHLPPLSHSYQNPPPIMYISSVPAPMSPTRQTAYPFMPTLPPQRPHMSWEHPYHGPPTPSHPPQPQISRRYSLAGPPPTAHLVEYPVIPQRPVVYQQHVEHSRPPVSFHESPLSYHQGVHDEAVLLEDNEAYYRHQEQARRAMPPPPLPPQRPVMRHATTASGLIRQTYRNSAEYAQTPVSSRAGSFSSMQDQHRGAPMVRTSSSREIQTRELPPAPSEYSASSRPKSFHAGYDRELAAEQYQAEKGGSEQPQLLTADAVKRANKAKSHKSKASESGSRSSSNRHSHATRRPTESHKNAKSEAVSIEVNQGCTATVTRDARGVSVHVRSSEENRDRPARPTEREESAARRSVSNRRESTTEMVRSNPTRRPSSSQPSMRRDKLDQTSRTIGMDRRLMDDTAVEDEECSEPEIMKKRSEKLTVQRVPKLKTPTDSRPNSRGARSVMSNRSAMSTTSSRRGIPVERSPS